jgi:hypothetical protein
MVLVAALAAFGGSAGASAAVGCRVAVAYFSGGRVLSPQPRAAPPVACGRAIGFAGAESHVVIAAGGVVVYTPAVLPAGAAGSGEGPPVATSTQANASPAGMAVSRDGGAVWSLVRPYGLTWNPTDHAEFVDRATGRLFFEDYGPIPLAGGFGALQEGPAYVMWSDDLRSWQRPAILRGVALPENPRFTAAPAPPGQPRPAGYPDVVYLCVNTNVGFLAPAILARLCFRSLDGGSRWAQVSELLNGLVPAHRECAGSGEDFNYGDGYYPEPAPDGTLYVLVSCGGSTYLARSVDEAASFPIIHTAQGALRVPVPSDPAARETAAFPALGIGPQLLIDDGGTMYVVYPQLSEGSIGVSPPRNAGSITHLLLIVSADHGVTWSSPRDITPPGAAALVRWTVAASSSGRLLVAAVCRLPGATTWSACITRVDGARRALRPGNQPLLWSAIVPGAPLLYGETIEGAGNIALGQGQIQVPYPFPLGIDPIGGFFSGGNDFIGATFAPEGTSWASFNQDCGSTPQSAGCVATSGQTRAFVASLRAPTRCERFLWDETHETRAEGRRETPAQQRYERALGRNCGHTMRSLEVAAHEGDPAPATMQVAPSASAA